MHWFWDHYVPDKSVANDWRVSPLLAADHAACRPRSSPPPSSTRCATTAAPTTPSCTTPASRDLRRYEGMIHGFYWMQGIADGAKRLHADLAEAIRGALQPSQVIA